MKTGLDRVTKEIDALTYNAKTITNALIRSTVAGGSSKGYSVTRVGTQITLDRVDIYRLSNFYREWEAVSFDINQFSKLKDEMDTVAVRDERGIEISTNATTSALVKHSKILYMNVDNISNATADDYWLGKLQNANNPKLISNSSPIPLNLRTPIFDENMGTDKYNTLPTYLFPYAYFALDYQGYSGDGVDHMMGGNSWDIQGDVKVSLTSPQVSLGSVNTSSLTKTNARRNNESSTDPFSTSFGFDTHARAPYSVAGGFSSIVPGDGFSLGSIAIGKQDIASGYISVSIGGEYNSTPGNGGAVVGGTNNTVIGTLGFIGAGDGNIVGAQVYDFTIATSSEINNCVIDAKNCIATNGSSSTGNDVILIKGNVVSDLDVQSECILFDYTVQSNGSTGLKYYDVNGDAFSPQILTTKSIRYESDPTKANYDYTIITLSGDVKQYGFVDGGRFAMYSNGNTVYGGASSAFGSALIAKGTSQTVVGEYNYVTIDDNFVVGCGTSVAQRYNSFESHKGGGNTLYGTNHHFYEFNNAWDLFDGDSNVTGIDVNSTSVKIMSGESRIYAGISGETFCGTFDQGNVKAIKGLHTINNVVDVINRGAIETNANRSVNIISGCTYDSNGVIHSLVPLSWTDASNALNILSAGNIGIKTEDHSIVIQSGNDLYLRAIQGLGDGDVGTIYIEADNIVFTGKSSAFAGNADGTSTGSSSDTTLPDTLSTLAKNSTLFINDAKYNIELNTGNSNVTREPPTGTLTSEPNGHLISYSGVKDLNTYTAQTFINYDLTLGQNSNDPYQMLAVRTLDLTTPVNSSKWGYLAWYEDIKYNGKWYTVYFGKYNDSNLGSWRKSGESDVPMNIPKAYNFIYTYSIVGNTLFYILQYTNYGFVTSNPPIDYSAYYMHLEIPCQNTDYSFNLNASDITTIYSSDVQSHYTAKFYIDNNKTIGIDIQGMYDLGAYAQFTGHFPIQLVKNTNGRPIG